jgi:hypothetical protein
MTCPSRSGAGSMPNGGHPRSALRMSTLDVFSATGRAARGFAEASVPR